MSSGLRHSFRPHRPHSRRSRPTRSPATHRPSPIGRDPFGAPRSRIGGGFRPTPPRRPRPEPESLARPDWSTSEWRRVEADDLAGDPTRKNCRSERSPHCPGPADRASSRHPRRHPRRSDATARSESRPRTLDHHHHRRRRFRRRFLHRFHRRLRQQTHGTDCHWRELRFQHARGSSRSQRHRCRRRLWTQRNSHSPTHRHRLRRHRQPLMRPSSP